MVYSKYSPTYRLSEDKEDFFTQLYVLIYIILFKIKKLIKKKEKGYKWKYIIVVLKNPLYPHFPKTHTVSRSKIGKGETGEKGTKKN